MEGTLLVGEEAIDAELELKYKLVLEVNVLAVVVEILDCVLADVLVGMSGKIVTEGTLLESVIDGCS